MEDIENKLIKDNWITSHQLNVAQQEAKGMGKSLWSALVKLGYLSEEDIAVFFAQESGFAFVKISDYRIRPEVVALLGENLCRQNNCFPVFLVKDVLFIACSNPTDAGLLDKLSRETGCLIEPLIAPLSLINESIDRYFGPLDSNFDFEKDMLSRTSLKGISYARESERLALSLPVCIKILDEAVTLHYSSEIDGTTHDISKGGTSVGVSAFLLIPKGTKLEIVFKPDRNLLSDGKVIRAKGEVVHYHMHKGLRYFMGIRFSELDPQESGELLAMAGSQV